MKEFNAIALRFAACCCDVLVQTFTTSLLALLSYEISLFERSMKFRSQFRLGNRHDDDKKERWDFEGNENKLIRNNKQHNESKVLWLLLLWRLTTTSDDDAFFDIDGLSDSIHSVWMAKKAAAAASFNFPTRPTDRRNAQKTFPLWQQQRSTAPKNDEWMTIN